MVSHNHTTTIQESLQLPQKYKTVLNWSGGKDSALTLQRLQRNDQVSVERLLVSVNKSTNRVSMHGVRKDLIEMQAERLGIPVTFLHLPENTSMEDYNAIMEEQMVHLMNEGFTHSAFGDIFLEDLREYREERLGKIGMKSMFPLWSENTSQLVRTFIEDGFKAVFVCVDTTRRISKYAGEQFSRQFLEEIPSEVDPCGENGEFHTFVYDAPFFAKPVDYQKGKIVEREYPSPEGSGKTIFKFCDLLPGE